MLSYTDNRVILEEKLAFQYHHSYGKTVALGSRSPVYHISITPDDPSPVRLAHGSCFGISGIAIVENRGFRMQTVLLRFL